MAIIDLYPKMHKCEYCEYLDTELNRPNLMIEVSYGIDPIRIIICKKCIKKILKRKIIVSKPDTESLKNFESLHNYESTNYLYK